ncbi:uncharacterized protein M6B38_175935 [Iris pallida]|uniref:Uncharacterized protein n=1 Tax=Iris pallida TaxID=29817 RepID=A0AAX6EQG0_IRIPA|nr:uncharacterized protein M6B38_175935 [Iris pallida]
MGHASSSTDNSRPRRLYNIGASVLTIVHKACQLIKQLDNPLGFVSRMMMFVMTPIMHPIERHWLLMLSFFDDRILAIEDAAMFIFPKSAQLFSVLDEVAILIESVPKWLDNIAIMDLPSLIRGEWSQEEKDIVVDLKCFEETESEQKMVASKKKKKKKKGTEDEEDDEIKVVEETCKDIVEEMEKMCITKKEEMPDPLLELLDAGWGGKEEMVELRDPLLELLDAGWGGKFT